MSDEVVLLIGAEGGSLSITRRFADTGRWEYRAGSNESILWDMLDELDGVDTSAPTVDDETPEEPWLASFDEALRELGRFTWPALSLIELHPDYQAQVLTALRAHPESSDTRVDRWESDVPFALERWRGTAGDVSAFEWALRVASVVHAPQVRKGTLLPYITHVVSVSRLLEQAGHPEPVVLAGLLHDVLEDADDDERGLLRAALVATFEGFEAEPGPDGLRAGLTNLLDRLVGPEVRWLVQAVTEKKATQGQKRPWKVRKLEALEHLAHADERVLSLKAADTLHNVLAIASDSRTTNGEVFRRFNASVDDLLWSYGTVAAIVFERLGSDDELAQKLQPAVRDMAAEADRTLGARDPFTGRRPSAREDVRDTTMAIIGPRSERINTLEQWRECAPPARGDLQWKDGRSAKELARAWVGDLSVGPRVPPDLRALLDGQPATAGAVFANVYPEHETSLDDFGKGRQHDLVAAGLAAGKKLLVAVEAKADETFGPLIREVLAEADETNARVVDGRGTSHRRERVEGLCRLVFGRDPDDRLKPLRYQLLHAVAGTILEARAVGAEHVCFVVHEFTGSVTAPDRVKANGGDLDAFVRALGMPEGQSVVPGTMHGPFAIRMPDRGIVELWVGKCRTEVS